MLGNIYNNPEMLHKKGFVQFLLNDAVELREG